MVLARGNGCYARMEEGYERRGREDVEKGEQGVNEAYFFVRNQGEDRWNDDGGGGKLVRYFSRQWREVGVRARGEGLVETNKAKWKEGS